MKKAKFLTILFVFVMLFVSVVPAGAVTDGELDG